METLLQDLRYGLRVLRKSPGWTAIAVLGLGLGIAAVTTIFAIVDIFGFRPLPFDREGRLVQVWATDTERGRYDLPVSLPDYLDWREQSRSLEIAAYAAQGLTLLAGGDPEGVAGQRVSANLFAVMNARPALGRSFRPEEEEPGADRVVVLSDGFWRRRFGADPAILGRTLNLDGDAHTVVGVLPADFKFPAPPAEVWAPLVRFPGEDRARGSLLVIGRLRPGVGVEQARAELSGIAHRLEAEYAATNAGRGGRVVPLREALYGGGDWQEVIILLLAAGFVLLIACANVANLLLARGLFRQRELGLRAALGADRVRLVRQLLTESLLLALIAGLLGVLLSFWSLDAFVASLTEWWPLQLRADEFRVDGRLLAYTVLVAGLAAVLSGLAPALDSTRPDLANALRESAPGATQGRGRGRLRGALVVSEISLALVLLIAAGLLIKGYLGLQRLDLGFDQEKVLTLRITVPEKRYAEAAQVTGFYRQLLERVEALPGIRSAGAVTILPGPFATSRTEYSVEGGSVRSGEVPSVEFRGVTPAYFRTLNIPVVRGRSFARQDREDSPPVAIINQAMARRHWADGDPIGKRLTLGSVTREIVGVVRDFRVEGGPSRESPPTVYLPALQRPYRSMALVVGTTTHASAVAGAVRAQVRAVDPGLPLYNVRTMREFFRSEFQGLSIMPKILGVLAAVALLLAVIGVYGVIAYSVSQRTGEIGIRTALGARQADILTLVVKQGVVLTAIGVSLGLGAALAVTRGLGWLLLGVSAFDPVIFVGATACLVVAAVAACYFPARRAARLDPMVALRYE